MRPYEVMVILSAKLEEETTEALLERLLKVITDGGGQIVNVDKWGRRRFAYPIEGDTEGFYVVIKFKADKATAAELERVMRITDGVVRHLLVREDEDKGQADVPAVEAQAQVHAEEK